MEGYLRGRLGCDTEMGADHWDDERLDFVPTILPAGVASPFIINLSDLTLVFQVRKPTIRVNSFLGALRTILRERTAEAWDISSPTREKSFDEWRRTVHRVVTFRARVAPPPDDGDGGSDLDRALKDMLIESASLKLTSETGIATDADIIRRLLTHVDRGYVHVSATGVRENGDVSVETVWDSELRGESLITAVAVDPATGEAAFNALFGEADSVHPEDAP